MVKKAKTKFLVFTLIAVTIFFSCLFLVVNNLLKKGAEHEISNKLTEIERFHEQDTTLYLHSHFICLITRYDTTNNSHQIKVEKSVGFSEESVNSITSSAISKNYPLGSIGKVYYKISYNNNQPHMIVAGDFSYVLEIYEQNLKTALITMLIILVIVFVCAWLFSFWVFKPINETLYKQRQFISDVSHELKTPVAIISANADVLRNIKESEYLENIKSQSKRMGLLVNDLLTLSSLDEGNGGVKKQQFCLSEAVLKATLPFDALAFEKGKFIKFDVEENLTAMGIREDVIKICEILLDNAVKYSLKSSEIIVTLKKDGKKNILSIFNRGCEVLKEDKDRIFERFYRADGSRARNLGGSGLGLSIAKSLAKRNKWKLSATPVTGVSMKIDLVL